MGISISPNDKIFEIETKYPVEDITYDSLPLWPYIRSMLLSKLAYATDENGGNYSVRKRYFPKVENFKVHVLGILHTNFFMFKKKKPAIFFVSNLQFRCVGNKVINQLTYYIEKQFKNVVPIVQTDLRKKNKLYVGHYIEERFIDDILTFRALKNPISISLLSGKNILENVIMELGVEFDYVTYISMVVYGIEYYTKWFERVTPQCIIAECYYDMKMPAIYAAKRLRIPTIELQHGIINKKISQYYCEKKFDETPYPEWLFCYSNKEIVEIENGNVYSRDHIIPIGNYYLTLMEEMREKNRNDFCKKYEEIITKKIVVVASQPTVDRELFDISKKIANISNEIAVIFVPRILEEYHKGTEDDNFYIETELNVYQLMQNANVVLGCYSTCLIEALYFGTPVVMFNIRGLSKAYYEKFLEGIASVCFSSTPEDTLDKLLLMSAIDRDKVRKDGKQLYKANYKENVNQGIKTILSQSLGSN